MAELQLLTNSRRNSHGTCHRRHYYEYELGARPIVEAEVLRFGTLIHAGLEAWLLALWQGPVQALSDALAALQANAPKANADEYVQMVAKAMIEGYHAAWKDEFMEVIAVEQHFAVPLMNPDTKGISRTWQLAGKIDAIVRVGGKVYILEHKTAGQDLSADAKYWTKLAIDGQVSQYYMGAKALGHAIDGCIYDVLRKPALRPCQVPIVDEDGVKIVHDATGQRMRTANGKKWRETASSEHGYVALVRPETPKELYARVSAEIAAEPDKYFRRQQVPRLESDLVEYLGDMWAVGREIAEAQSSGRWPKNPRSCDNYGTCPYFEVCAGRESIDNPHVFKRGRIHPELAIEATTIEGAAT